MLSRQATLLEKAKSLEAQGHHAKARELFGELLESKEAPLEKDVLIEVHFSLGNIFCAEGEIGKAIKAFERVLELGPNHTDAAISLSILYNDIGHYESAKSIFERADRRVKNHASGEKLMEDKHINKKFALKHYEMAEMYLAYHRYDEALFEYNKACALDTSHLEARVKVAKVYAKKKFFNKALDELKRLKNEHPKFAGARMALGILYYGSGRVLEARREWERVLSFEPKHEEAQMYLNLSKTATETRL